MFEIPTTVEIGGIEYKIRNDGDFRMVLDCFLALGDEELDQQERLFASLIIFYEAFNSIEDIYENIDKIEEFVQKMYEFFNCGPTTSLGTKANHKLIDWEQDSQIICSAVNKVAGKEIRFESYIHWWTFMGYYTAVGNSLLSTVITIRDKIVNNKPLEKYEKEFRNNNPQYFTWNSQTVEEKEADKLVRELWNSEN